jgi:hypothetical protein
LAVANCEGAMEPVSEEVENRSRQLAVAYRNLVLCFGSQLLLFVVNVAANLTLPGPSAEAVGALVGLLGLGSTAALAYFGYRTAEAMDSRVPWAWAVGMFVPCANVITLLILSSRATQMCRAAGIPVGFLGPKTRNNHG